MDADVVVDQEGMEEAINRGRDFIIAPEIEELTLLCYVHIGLCINLPIAKTLSKSLKNHKALKDFSSDSHNLCTESARWICGALATVKTLRTLGFADTFTESGAMKWLIELVKVQPKLTSFRIDENQPLFAYKDAKDLFLALEKCNSLETLYIRSAPLGHNEPALEALGNFLKRNNSVKSLTIGMKSAMDSWSDSGLAKIIDGIAENRSIVELKLLNLGSVGELTSRSLVQCLRKNQTIIELDLANTALTEAQIVPVLESIMVNDTIGSLQISIYHLKDQAFKTLAKYLEQTKVLQILALLNAVDGLKYFWEGFKKNTTLDYLSMHGVDPKTWPFPEVQQIIWTHPRITRLGWTLFYKEPAHPLTRKFEENKQKFNIARKEALFCIFLLAKSGPKFPTEIWSLILHHVIIPSSKHYARADKLFDCIVRHWDQIAQCLELMQPFKIMQSMRRFTYEEEE